MRKYLVIGLGSVRRRREGCLKTLGVKVVIFME